MYQLGKGLKTVMVRLVLRRRKQEKNSRAGLGRRTDEGRRGEVENLGKGGERLPEP